MNAKTPRIIVAILWEVRLVHTDSDVHTLSFLPLVFEWVWVKQTSSWSFALRGNQSVDIFFYCLWRQNQNSREKVFTAWEAPQWTGCVGSVNHAAPRVSEKAPLALLTAGLHVWLKQGKPTKTRLRCKADLNQYLSQLQQHSHNSFIKTPVWSSSVYHSEVTNP